MFYIPTAASLSGLSCHLLTAAAFPDAAENILGQDLPDVNEGSSPGP